MQYVIRKRFGIGIVDAYAAVRIQPHAPVRPFFYPDNIVIDQRIRIAGLMFEYFEFVTVVPVHSGCGTEPHKAIGIFKNTAYPIIGKAIGDIEM